MNRHLRLSTGEQIVLVMILMTLAGLAGYRWGVNAFQRQANDIVDVNPTDKSELTLLQKAFGPRKNSEHFEEWIIRDYFRDARNGVFVDVGANHYLETALRWSGVAIEPQIKFAEEYKQFRPKTVFVPLFISDVSNQQTTLFVTSE